jgi:hypothetical protein
MLVHFKPFFGIYLKLQKRPIPNILSICRISCRNNVEEKNVVLICFEQIFAL